jgi:chorismate dehydratase
MKVIARLAKIKVVSVSYLNTIPFIYGLDHSAVSGMIDLRLGNPYKCFQLFMQNEADVALIPVGSLPLAGECNILKPHCIGADGNVGSVFLLSDSPAEKVNTIFFDLHSLTSNKLVEILCKQHWKIAPSFLYPEIYPPKLREHEAVIAIGDKAFRMKGEYKFVYDLSGEWKRLTGNSFIFAVWATKLNLHPEIIQGFNEALSFGVENILNSISYSKPDILSIEKTKDYLTNNIIFEMNDSLLKGMEQFLDFIYPTHKNMIHFV